MNPRLLRSAVVELIRLGLATSPHLRAEAEGLVALAMRDDANAALVEVLAAALSLSRR